jgi:hypothetical protein
VTDPYSTTVGHRHRVDKYRTRTKEPESDDTDFVAHRPQVIYLGGRDPHAEAIGPRDFRLQRREDESEEAFEDRAIRAAANLKLPWLALQRHVDLGPSHRRDEAMEELV